MADVNESTITAAVLHAFDATPDPRTRQVLQALVRHLHAFVREVAPSEDEWFQAVDFLTRTGQLCTATRQEFILLSDTLGVTMLVDALSHRDRRGAGTTENSVLGPFYAEERPAVEDGADIAGGIGGTPLFFEGRVVDPKGYPVVGARADVWHTDSEGHYDVDVPGHEGPAMRAVLRTDSDGSFRFRSIMPASYPIPLDGTVGAMLRAAQRPAMRPAHLHVRIEAPGWQRVTTTLFVAGDPFLDADPVFGVKESLVRTFEAHAPGRAPDGTRLDAPFHTVRHTFTMAPA